jgi:hypothetical protein
MAEPSERGVQNVTLFDPGGPGPTFPSTRGTANTTLFDPLGPAPVQPSARGTANATLAPAGADPNSIFRAAEWNGFAWVGGKWFRAADWNGTDWDPID